MLDLHLQQTHGQLSSSFADPPSRLYPLEVIAVRQVREWLGLPTPKIEHALMFTNLVTMRPDPKWPRDDHACRSWNVCCDGGDLLHSHHAPVARPTHLARTTGRAPAEAGCRSKR
jgi:hypothetical protein